MDVRKLLCLKEKIIWGELNYLYRHLCRRRPLRARAIMVEIVRQEAVVDVNDILMKQKSTCMEFLRIDRGFIPFEKAMTGKAGMRMTRVSWSIRKAQSQSHL